MKKRIKLVSHLLLAATAAVSLSACSGNNNAGGNNDSVNNNSGNTTATESSTPALSPVNLKLMFFGDKPKDIDKVLAEFENRTKDTLNTKLDIEWLPAADYNQKLKLMVAAGENMDAAFDAPWGNLYNNINQGFYQELDKYFNNDEYPGLKAAFSEELLNSNKINGHIYAIPFTQFYTDIQAIFIRKDLREKWGLGPITSYDELAVYLDKVKENEPKMVPLNLDGIRGFQTILGSTDRNDNIVRIGGVNPPFSVVLSDDGSKVLGAVTPGDPDSMFADFPAPLNSPDYLYYNTYNKLVEWNQKYVEKDALSEKDSAGKFVSGKAAAMEGTISQMSQFRQRLQSAVPGADIEPFVFNEKIRNMEEEAIGVTYQVWNDLAIPVVSKNADRTMKFIDWIFQSQDNHDLLELGIEGTHWAKDGDKRYKSLDQSTSYIFPAYELTQSPTMSRINSDNDEQTLKLLEYSSREDTYYRIPLSGFVFNSDPVKTEVAKLTQKATEFDQITKLGAEANWKPYMQKYHKEMTSLGLDKLRAELIKQVQAYLDAGNK